MQLTNLRKLTSTIACLVLVSLFTPHAAQADGILNIISRRLQEFYSTTNRVTLRPAAQQISKLSPTLGQSIERNPGKAWLALSGSMLVGTIASIVLYKWWGKHVNNKKKLNPEDELAKKALSGFKEIDDAQSLSDLRKNIYLEFNLLKPTSDTRKEFSQKIESAYDKQLFLLKNCVEKHVALVNEEAFKATTEKFKPKQPDEEITVVNENDFDSQSKQPEINPTQTRSANVEEKTNYQEELLKSNTKQFANQIVHAKTLKALNSITEKINNVFEKNSEIEGVQDLQTYIEFKKEILLLKTVDDLNELKNKVPTVLFNNISLKVKPVDHLNGFIDRRIDITTLKQQLTSLIQTFNAIKTKQDHTNATKKLNKLDSSLQKLNQNNKNKNKKYPLKRQIQNARKKLKAAYQALPAKKQ